MIYILLTRQLLPSLAENVVHEGFTSHGVLARVTSRSTKEHNFLLAHNRDRVAESGLGDLTVNFECLDHLGHVDLLSDGLARSVISCSSLEWVRSCPTSLGHVSVGCRGRSTTSSLLLLPTERD